MNAKNLITKSLFTLAIISLTVMGCKKDKKEEVDNDTQSSSDNALAESSFNDVTSIADQANDGALSTFRVASTDGLMGNCDSIIRQHANSSNPDTLIITFGFNGGTNPAVNCLCSDGRNRKGTIIVVYTGHYRDSLSTHTISFSNYFVNDNQIMGTKTVKNIGRNAAGHPVFTIDVNGSVILANGGGTVTWVSSRTREWIAGYTTFGPGNWADDVYLISGSASGTSASGNTFTANITSPLKRDFSCPRWFISGTVDFTPSGKPVRTIDFGPGTCDDQATVTINGTVHTITLH